MSGVCTIGKCITCQSDVSDNRLYSGVMGPFCDSICRDNAPRERTMAIAGVNAPSQGLWSVVVPGITRGTMVKVQLNSPSGSQSYASIEVVTPIAVLRTELSRSELRALVNTVKQWPGVDRGD